MLALLGAVVVHVDVDLHECIVHRLLYASFDAKIETSELLTGRRCSLISPLTSRSVLGQELSVRGHVVRVEVVREVVTISKRSGAHA